MGPQSISTDLYAAASVIYEWGDGDNVDPDRMDTAVEHLAQAIRHRPVDPPQPGAPRVPGPPLGGTMTDTISSLPTRG